MCNVFFLPPITWNNVSCVHITTPQKRDVRDNVCLGGHCQEIIHRRGLTTDAKRLKSALNSRPFVFVYGSILDVPMNILADIDIRYTN